MQSLINEIENINKGLIIGIKDSYKHFGLCKEIIRDDEKQNFDIRTESAVVLDDKYKSFFYHKIAGTETYTEIGKPGKGKQYMASANINLIGFSDFSDFDDHLKNRLSQFRLVTINSIDYDSYKIIANETGKKDFNFKKYLFVVNYQLLYKVNNCDENCQS